MGKIILFCLLVLSIYGLGCTDGNGWRNADTSALDASIQCKDIVEIFPKYVLFGESGNRDVIWFLDGTVGFGSGYGDRFTYSRRSVDNYARNETVNFTIAPVLKNYTLSFPVSVGTVVNVSRKSVRVRWSGINDEALKSIFGNDGIGIGLRIQDDAGHRTCAYNITESNGYFDCDFFGLLYPLDDSGNYNGTYWQIISNGQGVFRSIDFRDSNITVCGDMTDCKIYKVINPDVISCSRVRD